MTLLTDRDAAAAAAGDEVAFTRIFRALQPALLRYLRTLAPAAAEDLAAETWLHVVRGLGSFTGDAAGMRAWVFTIAHHRYVDHVRRAGRQPAVVSDAAAFEVAAPRHVEDEVGELMSTEAALRLIGRLPVDQAEVVLLRVVAGLDVARTAQVLGKRPGAVRVLSHRGLRRLARLLDADPRALNGHEVTHVTEPAPGSPVTPARPSAVSGES